MPERDGPIPFGDGKKLSHVQEDGWELTEAPHGTIYFYRGGGIFDVCVWKCDITDVDEGDRTRFYPGAWNMSCHRQFGFSKHLKDAKDERTAKLMALAEVERRCRTGAYKAAKALVEVTNAHAKRDKELPPFREMPLGKPNHNKKCEICGAVPTVPLTKLCGPCTFGDPSTARGNW